MLRGHFQWILDGVYTLINWRLSLSAVKGAAAISVHIARCGIYILGHTEPPTCWPRPSWAWPGCPRGIRCGNGGAQPSGAACDRCRWSSSSWPSRTSCRNATWRRGSRTGRKWTSGCGRRSGHSDGTGCASYCGAYQSWRYPSSSLVANGLRIERNLQATNLARGF